MGATTMDIPYTFFTVLEDKFGREDATKIADGLKQVITQSEERTVERVKSAKFEVKDEVKRELVAELATKEDIARLEGATREDIAKLRGEVKEEIATLRGDFKALEGKMKLYFMTTIAVVVLLNKDALTLLGQILGLVK